MQPLEKKHVFEIKYLKYKTINHDKNIKNNFETV